MMQSALFLLFLVFFGTFKMEAGTSFRKGCLLWVNFKQVWNSNPVTIFENSYVLTAAANDNPETVLKLTTL